MKINYLTEKDILVINARVIQREGATGQKPHVRDAEALHFLLLNLSKLVLDKNYIRLLLKKLGFY